MKRKKLLTVKEARQKVLDQAAVIDEQRIKINRLQNEVESLEGARVNLKMMYDSHEMEKNRAKQETIDALASLKESRRQTDRACDVAEKFRDQVRVYENEKAVHMWVRSMKLAVAPIRKAISSAVERIAWMGNKRPK